MDILFVSNKYYPYVGGVQTQMRLVAHELASRHGVEVATLRPGQDSFDDGPIAVHALPMSGFDLLLLRLLRLIPGRYRNARSWLGYQVHRSVYLPKLRPLVRNKHVVHALKTGPLSRIAEEAARAEGVPFVVTPYFHPRDDAHTGAKLRAEAEFCNRADTVFALIETDREMLVQFGVERERLKLAGVMPLLPETTDPQGFRDRHNLGAKPIVLFIGRIIEAKGCKTILDAAPRVWQAMPDVHFVFAGPAQGAAPSWLSEWNDERVRYLGLIEDQEKGDALAACDLFCMPSIAEILPAVYLEAWSYGKAVIGGSAHGLRELIEDNGAGLTVPQDPDLLAARLLELLRDEPRRRQMGERGRELVARSFSKAALVHALEEAYATLHRGGADTSSCTPRPQRSRAQEVASSFLG